MFMEFGVATGGTIKIIARHCKTVYGFDWFKGLPEDWGTHMSKGSFECEIPKNLPDNVDLVVGLIQETLPDFLETHHGPVGFVHIDTDLYSSAKYILETLEPRMVDGTILAFDEIFGPEHYYREHEARAFVEFVNDTGFKYKCVGRHSGDKAAFEMFR